MSKFCAQITKAGKLFNIMNLLIFLYFGGGKRKGICSDLYKGKEKFPLTLCPFQNRGI